MSSKPDVRTVTIAHTETTQEDTVAGKFEVYQSGAQWRFRLKAANGEIVATGESYTTKAGAKEGCAAVQRAAAGASIEEV